ncbi:tyrosine recombinase XerS [Neobacillus notoginsengisoli]|uniref:Tyrosine recombinase XerS n=1 Tax=Neobacillus notoginsengisoli TaxID=1578198 RepID=A0A417YQE9_9BACI|nr:tyrosine recombinase XerS [Neobacillus notoginsengisoli]RHW36013.1 tyrosine recombinase XerS [Neobacillus notoginsengisoli]
MALSKQHEYYEKRLERLLKEMPDYIVSYVDAKQDIRSPLTLFNYVRDYREFLNWLISEGIADVDHIKNVSTQTLENLSLEHARNYFKFIGRKKYKVSTNEDITKQIDPKTVNRHKSSLRSLFKYLTVEAELKNNEPYFHRNVMGKIEVTKVTETLNERSKKITGNIFVNDRDLDFIDYIKTEHIHSLSPKAKTYFVRDMERNISIASLFLGSGIRVNELSNLRLKDIDFTGQEISVIRKGNKKDTVSVTPSSLEDLKAYLEVRQERYKAGDGVNEFVFVKLYKGKAQPLTNRAITDIIYNLTKAFDKRMSPHKLRHTYATNLAEQTNGDLPLIMSQLGHSSPEVALLYINTSREKARLASELLDKRRERQDQ